MAILTDAYIKLDTLKTLVKTLEAKQQNGIAINISINNGFNQWNQNVTLSVAQSKEERDTKKAKFYIGNGKVVWNDGKLPPVAPKQNANNATTLANSLGAQVDDSDLPF